MLFTIKLIYVFFCYIKDQEYHRNSFNVQFILGKFYSPNASFISISIIPSDPSVPEIALTLIKP